MLGTTIREAHEAFTKGLLTPSHMTRMALKRVKRLQPTLNAATMTLDERAVKSLENDLRLEAFLVLVITKPFFFLHLFIDWLSPLSVRLLYEEYLLQSRTTFAWLVRHVVPK